jgi:type IV secretory pathway TraG/TraD family ATPase VirD4
VEVLRWSPLAGCQVWDEAVARAHALATAARPDAPRGYDSHWVERAQALLAPLLHAAALVGADMAELTGWLQRRDLNTAAVILARRRAVTAANVLEGIAVTDPREQSGIFSTGDGLLAAYRSDATLAATQNPNFDPAAFATSRDTIYICAPATAQAQHGALVVALLDHLRSHIYRHHPYPAVLWALDEMANIAPLPSLPATVAEGGSQGLVIQACLQDLSQARHRWGPAADGFLTLFTHKIVLPGVADLATLRQISALAGDTDVAYRSVSRPYKLLAGATVTTHHQQRPRLPIDVIARGTPGQALHLIRGHPGIINLHPPTPRP